MILLAGMLHAQAPASGTQASPAPAATKGVAAAGAKPNEPPKATPPATPMQTAAQLYRNGKLAQAEAAYKEYRQCDPQSPDAYVGFVRGSLPHKQLSEAY